MRRRHDFLHRPQLEKRTNWLTFILTEQVAGKGLTCALTDSKMFSFSIGKLHSDSVTARCTRVFPPTWSSDVFSLPVGSHSPFTKLCTTSCCLYLNWPPTVLVEQNAIVRLACVTPKRKTSTRPGGNTWTEARIVPVVSPLNPIPKHASLGRQNFLSMSRVQFVSSSLEDSSSTLCVLNKGLLRRQDELNGFIPGKADVSKTDVRGKNTISLKKKISTTTAKTSHVMGKETQHVNFQLRTILERPREPAWRGSCRNLLLVT